MVTIELRLATDEDIPALKALIPASVRALSVGYYTDRLIESAIVYIVGFDTQLITDGTYFAAVADNQVVGCGGWSRCKPLFGGDQMKSQTDDLVEPAVDAAHLRAFFVHPDLARRGIGRRIIEACEVAAKTDGFSRMEVASTLPGEPFYAAMGYEVTSRFNIPMPDGESLPGVHMARSIA